MDVVRRVFKNTAVLFIARMVSQFLGLIGLVYLARIIGPDGFGKINFAMTIVGYFGMITNLGISVFTVREISIKRKNLEDLRQQASYTLSLRLFLALLAILSLYLFTIFLHKPLEIKWLILIYGLGLLTNVLSIDWAFQAVEKMEYMVLPAIAANLSYVILIILFIKHQQQLLLIPLLFFIGSALGAIISIIIFFNIFGRIKLNFDFVNFRNIIIQALPIGISGIMVQAFYQLPTVMLGFMRSDQDVGLYNSAYKLVFFLLGITSIYYSAIFPTISYYYKHSLELFKKIITATVRLMFILAIPLSVGGTILAGSLMHLIYGAKFSGGVIVLQILVWDVLLVYVGTVFGQGLIASHRQKEFALITILMAIICIILNFVLIPIMGISGCALAILITEAVGVSLQYIGLNKVIHIPLYRLIGKPLAASLVMLIFILGILYSNLKLPLFALISISACTYFISFYLLKGVTKEEIILLVNILLKKRFILKNGV